MALAYLASIGQSEKISSATFGILVDFENAETKGIY